MDIQDTLLVGNVLPSELSEDSIIACQKIAERCFQDTDPTKISHISLPEKTPHYLLKANIPIEMLIALVSRSVFNVCEIVENEEGDFVSLELPLEKIQTKLTFTEVTAEVALQHILFDKKYCDRSFMPDTDRQGKNDNDTFTASVNMRWGKHSYSIFDLEIFGEDLPKYTERKELLSHMWKTILSLYDRDDTDTFSDYRLFLESGRIDKDFGLHIYKKASELLGIYHTQEGKEFFFEQCKKSKVDKDIYEYYDVFISNLGLISDIFSHNPTAIEDYICYDPQLALQDIGNHIKSIWNISKGILYRKLGR